MYDKLLIIFLTIVSNIFLFLSLLIIYAATCIITVEKNSFINVFVDSISQFGFYPIKFFNSFIKVFLTFIVPIKFTFSNVMEVYTTGSIVTSILTSVLYLILSTKIFNISLRKYR